MRFKMWPPGTGKRFGDLEDFLHLLKERQENAPLLLAEVSASPLPRERPRTHELNKPKLHSLRRRLLGRRCEQQRCDENAFFQSQSFLLASLPLEIRSQIWSYALGGNTLHVVTAKKRLVALRCPHGQEGLANHPRDCYGRKDRSAIWFPGHYIGPSLESTACPTTLLSLPKTCRFLYFETINMIYELNKFDFNELDPIIYLPRTIRSSQTRLIRYVRLECHIWYDCQGTIPSCYTGLSQSEWPPIPHQISTWTEACNALAQMTALRDLRITLNSAYAPCLCDLPDYTHPHEKTQLLDSLRNVRASDSFEVFVYWAYDDPPRLDVPFELKYYRDRR